MFYRVLQRILLGTGIVLILIGLLFLVWAFYEKQLPYNEAGRYFDGTVVHLLQDVLGLVSIASACFVSAMLLLGAWAFRRQTKDRNF